MQSLSTRQGLAARPMPRRSVILAAQQPGGGPPPARPFNETQAQVKRLISRDRKEFMGNEGDIMDKWEGEFGATKADAEPAKDANPFSGAPLPPPVAKKDKEISPFGTPSAGWGAASPFAANATATPFKSKPSIMSPEGLKPDMSPDPIVKETVTSFIQGIGWQQVTIFLSFAGSIGLMIATFFVVLQAGGVDKQSVEPGVDFVVLNTMPSLAVGADGPPHGGGGVQSKPRTLHQHQPPRELFKEALVTLKWKSVRKVAAGLQNLGNTCFMNAVLQCLTHTAPLAEAFLSDVELGAGGGGANPHADVVHMTQHHVRRAFGTSAVISPVAHARGLKLFNKRFRLGRQEDSHEFLRCLLDVMHEACLKRFQPKPPPELATTTFVYRIFGGKLRSQIRCEGVDYTSSKFDPFLDMSLEVNRASSVRRALQHFTAPEMLDGANRYRCPKNGKLVKAVKTITVHEPPNVLTVHLKRFEFGGFGSKISKRVEFDLALDLSPFMSGSGPSGKGQPPGSHMYNLYSVLVHHGHSVHSGHYIAYVRNAVGVWHLCDDTRMAPVSILKPHDHSSGSSRTVVPLGSAGVLVAAASHAAVATSSRERDIVTENSARQT
ncbi:hypothetical protein FOA52_015708 [Chlamydomonas sp. UWO 241]|nr:hypothetical protein FOA52_015708 [Chlamydomonas sp. UWO 241]